MNKKILLPFLSLLFLWGCSGSKENPLPVIEADYVFQNVHVLTMEDENVLENYSVVVMGGKIIRMGPADSIRVSDSTVLIDGKGKYLMPGIAEMHAHIPVPDEDDELLKETLFLYLSNGVTTIRGMLGAPFHLELKEKVLSGEISGPRIFTSGPSLNGNTVQSIQEARQKVIEQKQAGYDFLKLHPGLTMENFNEIDRIADSVGISFSGHVSIYVGINRALEARYASIDHMDSYVEGLVPSEEGVKPEDNGFFGINFTSLADESRIAALAEKTAVEGVWIVPTQCLLERWTGPADPKELISQPEMKYMAPGTRYAWVTNKQRFQADETYTKENAAEFIALRKKILLALYEKGANFLLGSDAPQVFNVPGFSLQHEMKAMTSVGLTPYDVLASGTKNPARFFGREGDFGIVREGADADLILLANNPLEDIAHMENNEGVMYRGTWLSKEYIQGRLQEIEAKYNTSE